VPRVGFEPTLDRDRPAASGCHGCSRLVPVTCANEGSARVVAMVGCGWFQSFATSKWPVPGHPLKWTRVCCARVRGGPAAASRRSDSQGAADRMSPRTRFSLGRFVAVMAIGSCLGCRESQLRGVKGRVGLPDLSVRPCAHDTEGAGRRQWPQPDVSAPRLREDRGTAQDLQDGVARGPVGRVDAVGHLDPRRIVQRGRPLTVGELEAPSQPASRQAQMQTPAAVGDVQLLEQASPRREWRRFPHHDDDAQPSRSVNAGAIPTRWGGVPEYQSCSTRSAWGPTTATVAPGASGRTPSFARTTTARATASRASARCAGRSIASAPIEE